MLRYPGGKSRGAVLKSILNLLIPNLSRMYCEPFFGGGGVFFKLAKLGQIEAAILNDGDHHVANFWTTVWERPNELSRQIAEFKPTVEQFQRMKLELLSGEVDAFKFLVVNRLSHGGRGVLAGPQGGAAQTGKYGIDCRWSSTNLLRQLEEKHTLMSTCCSVFTCSDFSEVEGETTYYDPPYYEVGDSLYPTFFSDADHERLRQHVCLDQGYWVLSYNRHPWVIRNYDSFHVAEDHTNGNGGHKEELLITKDS